MNSTFINKRMLLALGLIVVTVLLAIKPYKATLASLHYYSARPILESWQQDASLINASNYTKAKQSMEKAIALHPDLALYTNGLSEILQWGVYAGLEQSSYYQQAGELLNASLLYRPSWALSWLSLAQIKWLNSQTDNEFLYYMQQAHELGENMPEVHILWSEAGLQLINKNLPLFLRLQGFVKQHVLSGLTHPRARQKVLDIIKQENKQLVVCSWLGDIPERSTEQLPMLKKRLKC